jgi:hypothetical protein
MSFIFSDFQRRNGPPLPRYFDRPAPSVGTPGGGWITPLPRSPWRSLTLSSIRFRRVGGELSSRRPQLVKSARTPQSPVCGIHGLLRGPLLFWPKNHYRFAGPYCVSRPKLLIRYEPYADVAKGQRWQVRGYIHSRVAPRRRALSCHFRRRIRPTSGRSMGGLPPLPVFPHTKSSS